VCCGVGMLWGIGASSRFRGLVVLVVMLESVAYDVGVSSVSSVFVMYACHEGCMSVIF
jgi:hypothetical protein